MTIEELKQRKRALGLTNEDLAKFSGVPLGTVQKIMSGATKAPRRETLTALEKVLSFRQYSLPEEFSYVAESRPSYHIDKKQGEYTLEDYLALPEERRVEMIDGVFYDMASPSYLHQQILVEIAFRLREQIEKCPHECFLFIAPSDVQLDRDDRTIVQPDIYIVCGRDKLTAARLFGAPDFAIEILSPSTRRKDIFTKGNKYLNAGVREYWLVDPDKKQIIQIDYEHGQAIQFYTFDQTVPVLISKGLCSVDFAAISERVAPFFEQPSLDEGAQI